MTLSGTTLSSLSFLCFLLSERTFRVSPVFLSKYLIFAGISAKLQYDCKQCFLVELLNLAVQARKWNVILLLLLLSGADDGDNDSDDDTADDDGDDDFAGQDIHLCC